MRKTITTLALVATIAAAATLPALADGWTTSSVSLTTHSLTTGASVVAPITAAFYGSADGNLANDTLYVPVAVLFGSAALAPAVQWAQRDGNVIFKDGSATVMVPVSSVDGVDYVPAFSTLGYLAASAGLVNTSALEVSLW